MTNQTKNVPELRFPEFDGEWEERKIGNYIVEIKKYDTQQHSSYSVATSSRRGLFKQAEYFDGNRVFSDKEVLYSVVPPNTITYRHMSDDNIFKFNINSFNESVLVSREYPVFDVNDYADKNFVFYELNNSSNFLKFCIKQKKGGTRTRLYFKVLENYETFYPEKTEQQKIGEFFSKLDRQIELEEQKLEKLEQQKKGYMQKIFSQELRFKDKNGNEYPEWEVIKLKDILSERKEYASKIGNYPHATLSTSGISLKSDRYNRDFLVKDKNKKYKVTIMNDICYNPANLKFGVITRNHIGSAIFSPIYITFEVNNAHSPLFIELLVTRNDFINRVRKYEQGTVYERMAVKPEDFLNYETKIPCLEEQEKIGDFFSKLDKVINKQRQKIDELKLRKQGLLQKMFV
ncbi:TPA: restriction endonuclease subunit S [Staphylococcus aureus]|uniref:restriction endonuclease subunit S n=3 Tax=Staphylococcus aureus TaxID=1280 RepID=UPI00094352B6|nr:restriction endonuclease subunit S [Staphylococcus aureus]MCD4977295.1 restriction endonuclease subunit S [Staphylococcus aureus]MCD5159099.1 restriction endonuclease subunit S [Staphylococcus aureus]MDT2996227.1 restriction endonuclease subunit S [Staphylococcus aureus]MDT3110547.1 restriction endonuclease subunit S [Staphylococcus aureus]ORT80408.1 restriction endonuclease subunit S [Staphylococcus aureus]